MEASSTYPTDADVVLIHGLWMTPKSWENWIERFEARGFRTIAPAWPGLEGREPEDLRRDPAPLADIDADKVLDHYERIIRAQERPPIIMGHSFGGAKESGVGARHGAVGIQKFCQRQNIVVTRFGLKNELYYFPYSKMTAKLLDLSLVAMFGRGSGKKRKR